MFLYIRFPVCVSVCVVFWVFEISTLWDKALNRSQIWDKTVKQFGTKRTACKHTNLFVVTSWRHVKGSLYIFLVELNHIMGRRLWQRTLRRGAECHCSWDRCAWWGSPHCAFARRVRLAQLQWHHWCQMLGRSTCHLLTGRSFTHCMTTTLQA